MKGLVIPDKFQAIKKYLTVGLDMYLNANGNNFAKVVQKLSLRKKYELVDMNDNLIASANQSFFALGTHYDIYDAQGKGIGSFDHELLKSLLSYKSKYSVKDHDGNPQLYTEELQFLGTSVNCYDLEKNLVCTMSKSTLLRLRDKWEVSISSGSADRRILAMMPTFLTAIQKNKAKQDKK